MILQVIYCKLDGNIKSNLYDDIRNAVNMHFYVIKERYNFDYDLFFSKTYDYDYGDEHISYLIHIDNYNGNILSTARPIIRQYINEYKRNYLIKKILE